MQAFCLRELGLTSLFDSRSGVPTACASRRGRPLFLERHVMVFISAARGADRPGAGSCQPLGQAEMPEVLTKSQLPPPHHQLAAGCQATPDVATEASRGRQRLNYFHIAPSVNIREKSRLRQVAGGNWDTFSPGCTFYTGWAQTCINFILSSYAYY